MALRWLLWALFAILVGIATTGLIVQDARATNAYSYDATAATRLDDHAIGLARTAPALIPDARVESALPLPEARGASTTSRARSVATNNGTDLVKYDADFAAGQLTSGGNASASQLDEFGSSQGWARSQSETGPIRYTDENGVRRLTIKEGSPRAPGSDFPHVEVRNVDGIRVDPHGNQVTRTSVGNHTPIRWDIQT